MNSILIAYINSIVRALYSLYGNIDYNCKDQVDLLKKSFTHLSEMISENIINKINLIEIKSDDDILDIINILVRYKNKLLHEDVLKK